MATRRNDHRRISVYSTLRKKEKNEKVCRMNEKKKKKKRKRVDESV